MGASIWLRTFWRPSRPFTICHDNFNSEPPVNGQRQILNVPPGDASVLFPASCDNTLWPHWRGFCCHHNNSIIAFLFCTNQITTANCSITLLLLFYFYGSSTAVCMCYLTGEYWCYFVKGVTCRHAGVDCTGLRPLSSTTNKTHITVERLILLTLPTKKELQQDDEEAVSVCQSDCRPVSEVKGVAGECCFLSFSRSECQVLR